MSNGLQQYRRSCKLAAVSGMCFCLVLSLASCAGGPRPSASFSDTPLHYAAEKGHRDVAELLIANGADVDAENKLGWTPLHVAADNGHQDVAELLITKGADVNARGKRGWTPLHKAVSWDRRDMVELLISQGAEVNARDKYGETPLRTATWRYMLDVTGLGEQEKSTRKAAYDGIKDVVELLIAKGADVNARKKKWGLVPLHDAVEAGHKEVVEMLIAHGADVNAKSRGSDFFDVDGQTALHIAAEEGYKEIAELLIAHGAGVNARDDPHGDTPLHNAINYNHRDVVELLIAKGADVNARNKWDDTPLDYALIDHRDALVELLRKHGAGKQR